MLGLLRLPAQLPRVSGLHQETGNGSWSAVAQLVKSLQRCKGCWFHPKLFYKTFMKVSLWRHWIPKQPLKCHLHQSVCQSSQRAPIKSFCQRILELADAHWDPVLLIDKGRFPLITCKRVIETHEKFRITCCSYPGFMQDMYPASLTGLPGPQTWIRSSISETSSIVALTTPMLHCRGDWWSNRGLEGHPRRDHLSSPQ